MNFYIFHKIPWQKFRVLPNFELFSKLIIILFDQACIKPVETGLKKDVPLESGDGIGITINKSKGWKSRAKKVDDVSLAPKEPETPKPLSVTLGDCLACSGCITSAEAVLIAEQSHEKVFEVLERKKQV